MSSILGKLDDNALALQYYYISNNSNALGEKHQLDKAKDGSWWSDSHAEYHGNFKFFLEKFGYYDIFLVDADSGNVVYSVFKELDFATSLKSGHYSNTGLAEAYNLVMASSDKSFIGITDMAKYYPSYEAPAAFISTPIYDEDGEKKLGVLVFSNSR